MLDFLSAFFGSTCIAAAHKALKMLLVITPDIEVRAQTQQFRQYIVSFFVQCDV